MSNIQTVLEQDIIRIDGGTGTLLQLEHGFHLTAPLWSSAALRTNLEAVREVHRAFLRAGAEIVTTATFRSNPDAYGMVGLSRAASWRDTVLAAKTAKDVVAELNSSALVAGSIAPVRDCYDGKNIAPNPVMRDNHFRQARALQAGGADLLIFETVPTLREARIMVEAATNVSMPFILSFTVNEDGRLLDKKHTKLSEAAHATEHKNRVAIGINCSRIEDAEKGVRELLAAGYRGAIAIYPNGISETEGPDLEKPDALGWKFSEGERRAAAAEKFVDASLKLVQLIREAGNKVIVGGCCGVTPLEISLLTSKLSGQQPDYRGAAKEVAVPPTLRFEGACCPQHKGQKAAFACAAA